MPTTPKELASRAIQKLAQPRKPKSHRHPFDEYRNPDYVAPVDGVRVRDYTADEIDRATREVTDEQREGIKAALAIAENQDARRRQQAGR